MVWWQCGLIEDGGYVTDEDKHRQIRRGLAGVSVRRLHLITMEDPNLNGYGLVERGEIINVQLIDRVSERSMTG